MEVDRDQVQVLMELLVRKALIGYLMESKQNMRGFVFGQMLY